MLTASIVFLLLATQDPTTPPVAARSAQPSPEYIQALKITIEKRRKRRAARQRMGERNREAVRQLVMAIDPAWRLQFPGGDLLAQQPVTVNRKKVSPRSRGDPFRTSLSRS